MTTLNIIMEDDIIVNGSDSGMDSNIQALRNMNGHEDMNCASKNTEGGLENAAPEKNKNRLEDIVGKNDINISPSKTGKRVLKQNEMLEDELDENIKVSPKKLIRKIVLTRKQNEEGLLEVGLVSNVINVPLSENVGQGILKQNEEGLENKLEKKASVSPKKLFENTALKPNKDGLEGNLGGNVSPSKMFEKTVFEQNIKGLEDGLDKNVNVLTEKLIGETVSKLNKDALEGEVCSNVVNVSLSKKAGKKIIKASVEGLKDELDKKLKVSAKKLAEKIVFQQKKLSLGSELDTSVINDSSKKVGKRVLKQNEEGLEVESNKNVVDVSPKKSFGITALQENKDGLKDEIGAKVSPYKKLVNPVFEQNVEGLNFSSIMYSSQRISGRCALRQTPLYDRFGIRSKKSFSPLNYKRKSDDLNFNENKRFAHDSSSSLTVDTPTWKYVASPFTYLWSPRPSTSYNQQTGINDSLHVNYDDTTIQDIIEESDSELVENGTSGETKQTSITKKSVTQSWCALM